MPLYEYQCESCGRRTEALQRLDDPPLSECPHCRGKLRKLLSAPAFQFKGSGWYLTDYARKGSSSASGETGSRSDSSSSAPASEGSSGGGKETGGEKTPAASPAKSPAKSGD